MSALCRQSTLAGHNLKRRTTSAEGLRLSYLICILPIALFHALSKKYRGVPITFLIPGGDQCVWWIIWISYVKKVHRLMVRVSRCLLIPFFSFEERRKFTTCSGRHGHKKQVNVCIKSCPFSRVIHITSIWYTFKRCVSPTSNPII